MADVLAFLGEIFTPNLITKILFLQKNSFFGKKAIFEKSEKIYSDSLEYYPNFRYSLDLNQSKSTDY